MKIISFFLFFLTFTVQSVLADSPTMITGRLVDTSQQPVLYASIGIVNTPVGTIADDQGRFTLYITDKVEDTDTVVISLIGYHTVALTVAQLAARTSGNPQIVMMGMVRELNEVRVDARNSRVKTLGKTGYKTSMVTNFALSELPRQNLGSEIGRKFNVSSGTNWLESFHFYMITNYDSVMFRLNVYQAKTMQNLLTKNVYIRVAGKSRQWVSVDLRPYQLMVSDDVVVSVQWIDSIGKGTALQMPLQLPATATHYYRYGSQDRWKRFRGMTTSMNLTFIHSR
ncbi:carboxypeptidase-like regulatory domain-containing protein [Spirosoma spitsbergense]|uniref:carboxypeptidase-like regulatory domain-containing protein n=1 Tax=Spirosoma spitsbergense TaxID=431554 RepID=UPI000377977B|nr:carboxypeptidase-like regulatory domain-containing protein [Spirosoma spitsbergense]